MSDSDIIAFKQVMWAVALTALGIGALVIFDAVVLP